MSLYQTKAMDILTFMVLGFVVVLVLLIIAAHPSVHRRGPDEEWERVARNAELKKLHRLRRQRDKIWFRIDSLHDEFLKRSSNEEPTKYLKSSSPSQASADDVDNWNDITLSYIKEKYEHFLKKD